MPDSTKPATIGAPGWKNTPEGREHIREGVGRILGGGRELATSPQVGPKGDIKLSVPAKDREASRRGFNAERNRFMSRSAVNELDRGPVAQRPKTQRSDSDLSPLPRTAVARDISKRQARRAARR